MEAGRLLKAKKKWLGILRVIPCAYRSVHVGVSEVLTPLSKVAKNLM